MMKLYQCQDESQIDIETYVKVALENSFKPVQAFKVTSCPLCCSTTAVVVGSYIYYSHFITLRQCSHCGLGYCDTRLDDQVIASHFETAYKDEEHFTLRSDTYQEVLEIIKSFSSRGKLLDVGCAKAHFLRIAMADGFDGVGCDISENAVSHCKTIGLTVHRAELRNIDYPDASFDVITCLDTLYYTLSLTEDLDKSVSLLRDNGILCFRLPYRNLGWLYYLSRVVTFVRIRPRYRNLLVFNPEHCYVFEVSVLRKYLEKLGLECVAVEPTMEIGSYKSKHIIGWILRRIKQINHVLRLPLGSVTVVFKKANG